jgi:hypothetical protein
MQHNATQYSTMQYNAAQYSTMQNNSAKCSVMHHNAVQCSTGLPAPLILRQIGNTRETYILQTYKLIIEHMSLTERIWGGVGDVHMPFEDLILSFRTGKFVRSLSMFTTLSVQGKFYNSYPLKIDKFHYM